MNFEDGALTHNINLFPHSVKSSSTLHLFLVEMLPITDVK